MDNNNKKELPDISFGDKAKSEGLAPKTQSVKATAVDLTEKEAPVNNGDSKIDLDRASLDKALYEFDKENESEENELQEQTQKK